MKPIATLVIQADDERARFLENRGIGKGLKVLSEMHVGDQELLEAEYADAPGRETAAPGMARHALDPRSSEEEQARELFLRRVVEAAGKIWAAGNHRRIVLSAAPKVLGKLRELLPAPMREAVVVELNKDLLNIDPRDLPRHYEDHILF